MTPSLPIRRPDPAYAIPTDQLAAPVEPIRAPIGQTLSLPQPDAPEEAQGSIQPITPPNLNGPKMQVPAMLNRPSTGTDVSRMTHEQKLSQLEADKPGVEQIHSPVGRTLARIGDVAASIFVPRAASFIPGTTMHHQQLIDQEREALGANAKQGETEARTAHENAQADESEAIARAKDNPQPKQEEAGKTITTDQGIMQWNPQTQRYDIRAGSAPAKDQKETGTVHQLDDGTLIIAHPDGTATPVTVNGQPAKGKATEPKQGDDFNQFYQTYLKDNKLTDSAKNRLAARTQYEAAGRAPKDEEGTWQIAEDSEGKPVLYNSKTGQTKAAPANLNRPGTHAKAEAATEKNIAPVKSAIEYADNYIKNGVFTGPGDEALQEKFFELAKPSTGFRMTQPQMNMLQQSRGWMGSLEAKARHAVTGQWFTPEQRQQIVSTMKQLGEAKLGGGSGSMIRVQIPGQAPGSIPANRKDEFLKAHPDAKVF